jgi:hypothetical protein
VSFCRIEPSGKHTWRTRAEPRHLRNLLKAQNSITQTLLRDGCVRKSIQTVLREGCGPCRTADDTDRPCQLAGRDSAHEAILRVNKKKFCSSYDGRFSPSSLRAHGRYTVILQLLPNKTLHLVRPFLCTSGLITPLPHFYSLRRIHLLNDEFSTKYVLES